MSSSQGISIHITGIVQGVGFRPYVYSLAKRFALAGWVRNTSAGVDIEVSGPAESVDAFLTALKQDPPPLATIDEIQIEPCHPNGSASFEIIRSERRSSAFQPVSPDADICPDCLRELFEDKDRRYLYPFINCTNCGPRFTIIKDIPYDRANTSMADFKMCADCYAEYTNPADRRFHAQPVACPDCGPKVWLEMINKGTGQIVRKAESTEAIVGIQRLLRRGQIVAIKGLGGFHLACDASNRQAVAKLRRRKMRTDKPFALMMADIATIEDHCLLDNCEIHLLTSRERPIVILRKRRSSKIALNVAPGQNTLGVMLPYTPLHHLLFAKLGASTDKEERLQRPNALVMTSGNLAEEPIAVDNHEARDRLASLVDAFLMHDRPIHVRCDDSVLRILAPQQVDQRSAPLNKASTLQIRRSRGYVPSPVRLPWSSPAILATGPELKNTFCLTKDRYAFLSHHIGDLENFETLQSFENGIAHFEKLYRIKPQIVAHDLHPDYMATQYALKRAAKECLGSIGVQHHYAHIAACMAENGFRLDQPNRVLGIAFDGTGFGDDGAIWGGEFFIADYHGYERVFHLSYVPLPGGDSAIKEPWRIALSWMTKAGIEWSDDLFPVRHVRSQHFDSQKILKALRHQLSTNLNAPPTSSMGRLFDAVASICDVRQEVNYEAQAAMELQACIDPNESRSYPFEFSGNEIDIAAMIHEIVADIRSKVHTPVIAARFHNTIAEIALSVALALRKDQGISEVILSGGVWQNIVLLKSTLGLLRKNQFVIHIHQKIPTNDGGVSLGQAVIASARLSNQQV